MDEKELQEFSLEDILKEFGSEEAQPEETAQETEVPEEQPAGVTDATIRFGEGVTDQTIRLDEIPSAGVTDQTIRLDASVFPKGQTDNAQPLEEEEAPAEEKSDEAFSSEWEPEYDQPIAEYIPPQPIQFHPRSRLRELKRKLVAGPEKQYYALSERGLGKLQIAIFLSLLVVLISAVSTAMYALGMVQENRMRLMVFWQFLAMLVSALLGSFQLIEGVTDIMRKRFTLNTLMVVTFVLCCVDGVLCLKQLRVPCCAAFSLQVTMSLWSAYQRRNTQIGQLDTMRKATRLDSIGAVPEYYDGRAGLLRGEGQVEDFMDTYEATGKPEKILSVYAMAALIASLGVGITAGILHGVSMGIRVTAVTLLAAMPATAFIAVSRPIAVLERRLHSLGTVLCGWQGIEGLCKKAVFPMDHPDLFPAGTVKLNGVKFYGSRSPDEVVAYATAVICADGGGLVPLFTHLLDSRNGIHYDAENLRAYEVGGIGAEVCGEPVLVGTLSFLKSMGVEVPEGIRVSHAVCVAVDGELSGLFAVAYEKTKDAAAGLATLCGYRGLRPILVTNDFMLTESFLRGKFGIGQRKVIFPEHDDRNALRETQLPEEAQALALTTKDGLAPFAYAVTGARSVWTASVLGVVIHMLGGVLGIAIMLTLAILGAEELLTPGNLFLYELVWMLPGLIITEWTRHI